MSRYINPFIDWGFKCLFGQEFSKEEMEKYEESQRQVTNYNLGMYSAWQEGNQKGKQEGKQEEKLENAKRLLALGVMPKGVAEGTQLPLDQVLSLVSKA